MRQRLLARLAGEVGVQLILALPEDSVENLISVVDLHFVCAACKAYGSISTSVEQDFIELIRDLRPEAFNPPRRWQLDSEAESDMLDYLEYRKNRMSDAK